MVFCPYLIADMSWLCTGWVKGGRREGPRMSDGWRPCGQDSLLLGFHLQGKQLHISENILSETSVYCTNVLETPADVSSVSPKGWQQLQAALYHVPEKISLHICHNRMLQLIQSTDVYKWIIPCVCARTHTLWQQLWSKVKENH